MDINGGDKNRVFLHDLIKITEGTVSEGTIFMHITNLTDMHENLSSIGQTSYGTERLFSIVFY